MQICVLVPCRGRGIFEHSGRCSPFYEAGTFCAHSRLDPVISFNKDNGHGTYDYSSQLTTKLASPGL
jgi:hypothetical protein